MPFGTCPHWQQIIKTAGLLGLFGMLCWTPNTAQAAPTSQPTTTISCGLTKQQQTAKRRLLGLAHFNQLQGFTAGINWASQQPWLNQAQLQRLQQGLQFLQGRMFRYLGIQWQHGIWLSVFDRGTSPTHPTKPYPWMPTQRSQINWKLARKSIDRLEITVDVRIKRSFWLNFALKQLLGLTQLTSYTDRQAGNLVYWISSGRGVALAMVITQNRILFRPIWDDSSMHTSQGRRTLWKKHIQSILNVHQHNDFLTSQQAAQQAFPQATQAFFYTRPQAICHLLAPLPFPLKRHTLHTLSHFKGYGVGALLSSTQLRAFERTWFAPTVKQPTHTKQKPFHVDTWLPLTTRWTNILQGQQLPLDLLTLVLQQLNDRPQGNKWFQRAFVTQLANTLEQTGAIPGIARPWKRMWAQSWFHQLLKRNTISWLEAPTIIKGKRHPMGLFAIGRLTPTDSAMVQHTLEALPGIKILPQFGQPNLYLYPQPNGKWLAFALTPKRWFAANTPQGLSRLLSQRNKPPKGHLRTYQPTESLLHLQSWNRRWNIVHINPARLGCAWQPAIKDRIAKRIARVLGSIELATLRSKRMHSATLRLGWQMGGTQQTKTALPNCWSGSPWWRQSALAAWGIFLKSPIARLALPYALLLVPNKPTSMPTSMPAQIK